MTVAYTRFETSVAFTNAFAAGSQKTRIPRTRHIRSLKFYADYDIVVGTATEIGSAVEAIEKIEIEWDQFQQRWWGRSIPVYHQAWWGQPIIVGPQAYKDEAISTVDVSAAFRLPLGAVARSNRNVDITVTLNDGSASVETEASADATLPTMTVYIGADYVDSPPSHAYVTWTDVRDGMAAQTDFVLPFYETAGTSIEKIVITTCENYTDWVADTTAGAQDNLWANYSTDGAAGAVSQDLTDLEFDLGGVETWDLTSVIPTARFPTMIYRPQTIANALTAGASSGTILGRNGDFVIDINQIQTSAGRLRLNATTTDVLVTVIFAIPNASSGDEAGRASGSTPVPPGGPSGPVAGGGAGAGGRGTATGFGTKGARQVVKAR